MKAYCFLLKTKTKNNNKPTKKKKFQGKKVMRENTENMGKLDLIELEISKTYQ